MLFKGDSICKLYRLGEEFLEDLWMGFRGVAKPLKLYKILLCVCVYVHFSQKNVKSFNYYLLILKGKNT